MEFLAFLIVIGAVVWLGAKINRTSDEAASVWGQLTRLENELFRLKGRVEELARAGVEVRPEGQPASKTPEAVAGPVPVAPVVPTAAVPPPPPVAPALQPPAPSAVPARPALAPAELIRPWAAPAVAPQRQRSERSKGPPINWEQFMGAKLFAWLGGLALFLAVAFFVKYSFERNLIPPALRVALGFLSGLGLVVGGVLLRRKAYEVTAQTLCATGVVVLYLVSFGACGYYHLINATVAFALMVLVTVTAFLLAVRLNALVVAVLGLVGGFLTPPLVSTGVDNPLGLFGYIALLDIGLMAVALKKRWHFLLALGAAGTVVMQFGWAAKFFAAPKVFIAMSVFLGFDALFLASFVVGRELKQINRWLSHSALALPVTTLVFVFWMLQFREVGERPGVVFSFILGADLCLLALVLQRHELHGAHLLGGTAAFAILSVWTIAYLTPGLMNWALAGYLGFAVLHALFPVVFERLRPGMAPVWWGHLFPPLALVLVMMPLLRDLEVSWLLWPVVLLIDVVAIGLALLTASVVSILAVLALTVAVTAIWILRIPAELTGLPPLLLVVGGFGVFFFVVGLLAGEKILARLEAAAAGSDAAAPGVAPATAGLAGRRQAMRAQIPSLAAILPFLLLIMAAVRLPLVNPSSVYGLAVLLLCLLLAVTLWSGVEALPLVGLVCALALEYSWHQAHFAAESAVIPLAWNLIFTGVFFAFPFLFRVSLAKQVLPWAAAALAGPMHFYLVYQAVDRGFPNSLMGLLPAAFAVPAVLGLCVIARAFPAEHPRRNALLAWFGGSALFFATLIFPIQWDKQWITIGWALEGAALLWLFHRVPHPGLRATGVALLTIAFTRLAFNPAVLHYNARSATRIWNWYLYAYGLVSASLMTGGALLAPPRNRVWRLNAQPWLYTLGTVLAFLLLNLEIADYFSEGSTITFEFRGNLARDMSYSIGWALFALLLLIAGLWKRARPVRYAGMALLGITLLKLFLFDLRNLDTIYRIGAFLSVAIISIVAAVLYQRFFAAAARAEAVGESTQEPK